MQISKGCGSVALGITWS